MVQRFATEIIEIKEIAKGTKHIGVKVSDSQDIDYIAGQFISIHFEHQGKEIRRNYSIANAPRQDGVIEFACSYVPGGIASEYLFNLNIGDLVSMSGPYGQFILPRDQSYQQYWLIGTGTGITPYRAMLKQLQSLSQQKEVYILQGVRGPDELIYGNEFQSAAENNHNLRYYICYSRYNDNLSNNEKNCYVQDMLDKLNLIPDDSIIYLCGNPNMIDSTLQLLTTMGIERKRIRREKYISTK